MASPAKTSRVRLVHRQSSINIDALTLAPSSARLAGGGAALVPRPPPPIANRIGSQSAPSPSPRKAGRPPSVDVRSQVLALRQQVADADRATHLLKDVTASIQDRQRLRFASTIRLLQNELRSKPPPPEGLTEEEIALSKRMARRGGGGVEADPARDARDNDDEVSSAEPSGEDDAEEEAHLPTIITPRTHNVVKYALLGEVNVTHEAVALWRNTALEGSYRSPRELKVEAPLLAITQGPTARTTTDSDGSPDGASQQQSRLLKSLPRHLPKPFAAKCASIVKRVQQPKGIGNASHDDSTHLPRLITSRGDAADGNAAAAAPLAEPAFVTQRQDAEEVHSPDSAAAHRPTIASTSAAGEPSTLNAFGQPAVFERLVRVSSTFDRNKNMYKHTQAYRQTGYVVTTGEGAVHRSEKERSGRVTKSMREFIPRLAIRTDEFNGQCLNELQRVREAQSVFHDERVRTLHAAVERGPFTPFHKAIHSARSDVMNAALKKDHDERLTVFDERMREIESGVMKLFPLPAQALLHKLACTFLADVRSTIAKTNGLQGTKEFDLVFWHHPEDVDGLEHFQPQHLFIDHVCYFISLISPMFGLSPRMFMDWADNIRAMYQERDMNKAFRAEEIKMGRDAATEVKFKATVVTVRGVTARHEDGSDNPRPAMYVRVAVERSSFQTAVHYALKPMWQEHHVFQSSSDQSLVACTVYCQDTTLGVGKFSVHRFVPGRPSKLWIPLIRSNGQPSGAELNVVVDVFPPVAFAKHHSTLSA